MPGWSRKFLVRVIPELLAVAVLVVFGQNCSHSKISFEQTTESSGSGTTESLSGNGQGYDGKPYVHTLPSGVCNDQSSVESRIEIRKSFAQLTRSNCVELAPAHWKSVEISQSFIGSPEIFYEGVRYVDAASMNIAAPTHESFSVSLNFNGPNINVDGVDFGSADLFGISGDFARFENQSIAITPSASANKLSMLRSSVWGGSNTVGYHVNLPLPDGDYEVYFYTWEDSASSTYSLALQGISQGIFQTPAVSTWERRGPYLFNVSGGILVINVSGRDFMISGADFIMVGPSP